MANKSTERGLEVFSELMGSKARNGMEQALESGDFGSDIAELACEFAFAKVWDRQGLERKQRSLVTIGVLVAQRQTSELKNHVRIGLTNGLSVGEIEEALIQTLPYVGFPAVASASTAIMEVLREQGVETQSHTPEERGLL